MNRKRVDWVLKTYIYIAEPLHCSAASVTILLIGYTSMQNKKLKKLKQLYLLVTCRDWSLSLCVSEGRVTLTVFQLTGDCRLGHRCSCGLLEGCACRSVVFVIVHCLLVFAFLKSVFLRASGSFQWRHAPELFSLSRVCFSPASPLGAAAAELFICHRPGTVLTAQVGLPI